MPNRTKLHYHHINQNIDIAPVNTDEELRSAEYISDVFASRGFDPVMQEVAGTNTTLVHSILYILIFLGALLCGIKIFAVSIIGFILLVGSAILLGLEYTGRPVLSKLGPTIQTQNVIAYHKGEGEYSGRGVRPIVIVAHYDTPREKVLVNQGWLRYIPVLYKVSVYGIIASIIISLIALLFPIPTAVHAVMVILALILAAPALVIGIADIIDMRSPETEGANDNKSGLSVLLGVMDQVVNPKKVTAEELAELEYAFPNPAQGVADEVQAEDLGDQVEIPAVQGVRHGLETIRQLGILPASTEIVYENFDAVPQIATVANLAPEFADAPQAATAEPDHQPASQPSEPVQQAPAAEQELVQPEAPAQPVEPAEAAEPAGTEEPADPDKTILAPAFNPQLNQPEAADSQTAEEGSMQQAPAAEETAAPEADSSLDETSNLSAQASQSQQASASQDADDTQAKMRQLENTVTGLFKNQPAASEAVSSTANPGVTSPLPATSNRTSADKGAYEPQINRFAQRAILHDLPDPSELSADPFETGNIPVTNLDMDDSMEYDIQQAVTQEETRQDSKATKGAKGVFAKIKDAGHNLKERLFKKDQQKDESLSQWLDVEADYNAKEAGEEIGNWDNFNQDESHPHWKGGATPTATNPQMKIVEGGRDDQVPPTDQELRQAVYDMPEADQEVADDQQVQQEEEELKLDPKLLGHDIWFVAAGGSEADHLGIKTFLAEYRRQLRGCFLINLDCVGAGDLTLLSNEGLTHSRRADRRISRLVASVAEDMGLPIDTMPYTWAETDATPAMRMSIRSATLMGVDPALKEGVPALSGSIDDIYENVDVEQLSEVCDLVTEVIRRA